MTSEEWDTHYWRVKQNLRNEGFDHNDAAEIAERETEIEFGPRPREERP